MSRLSLAIFVCTLTLAGCDKRPGKPRILIFTKTAGFHHSSISVGVPAILKLAAENNFEADTTSDASWFREDSLSKYAAVVFLNTTGDLLNNYEEADFERYIQAGGGYMGIHAASDAEYDWGWYGRLVGGWFNGHPSQQEAVLTVVDSTQPATKGLPHLWKRKDEWYNFKKLSKDTHILLTIDEKSYQGGTNGDNHPMAWYHDFDGGRAFYTELGHTEESYSDPLYLQHILGGILYAIGDNRKLDYAKATTLRVPDEDRFTKTQLVSGSFYEPTEMTILPNLDILVTQRRGEIMVYKNDSKSLKQAGFLDVYYKTVHTPNVNAEEGLLGIQKDPDFAKNHFIYMYYSPVDSSVNRLSRFTFENDTILPSSEKTILEVHSQREICCHTGGSIAFGQDRMLYLSAGDNSTPFNQPNSTYQNNGFAPIDGRPGFMQYDARRSAGNTNDLRGKIMRIRVKEDGSYEIPDGNLFPKGTPKTRPEIYVMGNRNPYRISVDQKNGFLYWGEVGPDANNDSFDTRGSRGYDEVNQARKAGYFGWPLFVGDNYPYREYDYNTGKSGPAFDPAKPINNSPYNTGLQELPPAQPAFIWYPYGESKEFPQVGTGGRTAMAGPVYYPDLYPDSTRYPDYYKGKLFIYEWIRGWIKVVTMRENGDLDKIEPFMAHTKFSAPIDMETGPDGRIYILEYGSGWFSKNDDAGLCRIDFNGGNRPPRVDSITVDKTSGDLPMTVNLAVKATDPEHDAITGYTWTLGDGTQKVTTTPTLAYTYTKAGDYTIYVEPKDDKGASSKSDSLRIYAGNEAPTVSVLLPGNKSFYFPGEPVKYEVGIEDKDDTAKTKDLSNLIVSADYAEGSDKASVPQGHRQLSQAMIGKNLMLTLDCKSCHKVSEKSIGPAFEDVSAKYQKDKDAIPMLTRKIIKGGSGVWGEVAMAAHPNLKEADIKQILTWILSLKAENKKAQSLPASGSLAPGLGKPLEDNGWMYITAFYTDKGGPGIRPLSGTQTVSLRNSKIGFGGDGKNFGDGDSLKLVGNVDLTGIRKAQLTVFPGPKAVSAYTIELRLDGKNGKKIGVFSLPADPGRPVAPADVKAAGDKNKDKGANKDKAVKKPTRSADTTVDVPDDGKHHTLWLVAKAQDPSIDEDLSLSAIQLLKK